MNLEIVLLRHGIAENRGEDGTDFTRRLTKEGKEKLEKRLPNLMEIISYKEGVEIWSSPLLRAKETAEILAKSLNSGEVQYYDFIANGSLDELLKKLVEEEKEKTIFVVGHEPYLGDWSFELSDQSIEFKKGAAAAFKVTLFDEKAPETKDMVEDIEFSWYRTPKEMENPRMLYENK